MKESLIYALTRDAVKSWRIYPEHIPKIGERFFVMSNVEQVIEHGIVVDIAHFVPIRETSYTVIQIYLDVDSFGKRV